MTTDEIFAQKELMCEIGHRIWLKGFCAGNEGNHSIRISEDRILCTPTLRSKGFIKPDMICTVDLDGKQVDEDTTYRPSSEVKIHLAIYHNSPDTRAVIHSHPPHAAAFVMSGQALPEGMLSEAELFLGRVEVAPYETPGSVAVADGLIPHIKEGTNTILMANHGVVTFGEDFEQTYYNLEILDAYCRILILNRAVGSMKMIPEEKMEEIFEVKQRIGIVDGRAGNTQPGWMSQHNEAYLKDYHGKVL